ncbi:hypothetical protein QE374_002682 [Microbacterium sp. SORGH_AS428]|nr:hypothetical protein [Microbacterium sp. SORGH_AS_0428]
MTRSDDRSSTSSDNGSTTWTSDTARSIFWSWSVIGLILLTAAWFWYGASYFEEMSDACKSRVAGSSGAGTGLLLGAVPLVLAYFVAFVPLIFIGATRRVRRLNGVWMSFAVLLAQSAVAVALNELFWAGQLFQMSASAASCG